MLGFIDRTAAAVSAVLLALKPGRTPLIQAGHWCYSATVSAQILVLKAQLVVFLSFQPTSQCLLNFPINSREWCILCFLARKNGIAYQHRKPECVSTVKVCVSLNTVCSCVIQQRIFRNVFEHTSRVRSCCQLLKQTYCGSTL